MKNDSRWQKCYTQIHKQTFQKLITTTLAGLVGISLNNDYNEPQYKKSLLIIHSHLFIICVNLK